MDAESDNYLSSIHELVLASALYTNRITSAADDPESKCIPVLAAEGKIMQKNNDTEMQQTLQETVMVIPPCSTQVTPVEPVLNANYIKDNFELRSVTEWDYADNLQDDVQQIPCYPALSRSDKPVILERPISSRAMMPSDSTLQHMYPLFQQSEGITPGLRNVYHRAGNQELQHFDLQVGDFQMTLSPKLALESSIENKLDRDVQDAPLLAPTIHAVNDPLIDAVEMVQEPVLESYHKNHS